jgi:hypothetical protein
LWLDLKWIMKHYLHAPAYALGDSDVTSMGPVQISNKLNNLIILININLFNLKNKFNINYNVNYDI